MLFVGVGEITAAGKASAMFMKIARAAQVLDFLTLSRYFFKTLNGLRIYRLIMAEGKYFFAVVKNEAGLIIKLTDEFGQILKHTDFTVFRKVELVTPNGTINTTILVDPLDDLSGRMI